MGKHKNTRRNKREKKRLNDLNDESNNPYYLPDEIWGEVFKFISPSFINSPLNTSIKFKKLAESSLTNGPLQFGERTKFSIWKQKYKNTQSYSGSLAGKLLNNAAYNDYDEIRKMQFNPEILFYKSPWLQKSQKIISHINNLNNQYARDQIFKNIYSWFVAKTKSNCNIFSKIYAYVFDITPWIMAERTTLGGLYYLMDFAIGLNQVEFVKKHSKYLQTYIQTNYIHSPLKLACQNNFSELVGIIINENGLLEWDITNESNFLVKAVKANHLNTVRELLKKFEKFKQIEIIEAMRAAIDYNHLEMLKLLLHHLSIKYDELCVELFTHAFNKQKYEAAKLIVSNWNVVITIIKQNNVSAVRRMFALKLDVDELVPGHTLLHVAANYHAHEVVDFLTAYDRTNPTVRNYEGKTPLEIAKNPKKWMLTFQSKAENTIKILSDAEVERKNKLTSMLALR